MKERIRASLLKDEKYKDELKLINSSYITTFDSYALSIVKKYHYLLNIPKNIAISDESIIKIEQSKIIDRIFENEYKNNNEDFLYLIDTYSVKNDSDIRKNILKICSIISDKINYKEYIDNIKNNFFSEENILNIYNTYLELLNRKRNELKIHLDNFSYLVDNNIYTKFYDSLSNILNCDIKDIHLYSSTSLPRVNKYPSDESKIAKKDLSNCLDELKNLSIYGDYNNVVNIILSSKRNMLTILDIVNKYIIELNNYKSKNNIYTFSDIAYLSIKVLKDNEDVRNEVKSSFKEIMIDEYQDTNDVQDTFIKLIENNNVYMVGDIKQSIYKFRGSNPNIFKEKYDNYSINNGGMKIDLIKNFRSRSEVLKSINNIFELLMDNSIGDAKYRESHEMVYGLTLYDDEKMRDFDYNTRILEYNEMDDFDNNEIEMFTIATDIINKLSNHVEVYDKNEKRLREANYSDFVIILDRGKYFDSYKKVFEYMGIPLTILKDDNLTNNNDLFIIKNLIDLVIKINNKEYDINFRYDFVSIARSFLYEYSDNEIYDIIKNNKYYDTQIYKDLSSINNINSKSVSDLFYEVLKVVDYYNKLYKIGDINNTNIRLRTIYNISNNLNDGGYDIYDFINYLNDINNSDIDIKYKTFSQNTNSVKIMTIHGSKGLEYPFCYFADLAHKFNDRDIKDKFIVSDKYAVVINDENNNLIKDLYKYEYKRDEISERLRLFYVALTRAREQAIIVLPYTDSLKYSLNEDGIIDEVYRLRFNKLSDFISSIKEYLNDYFSMVDNNKINITKNYMFTKNNKLKDLDDNKYLDVKEIIVENNIIKNEHYSKEKIDVIDNNEYELLKVGTKVHSILEYIDFKNYDESLIEDKYIRNKINKFMSSDILKDINNSIIYKEYEFKYKKDNKSYTGIIDLMIEHDSYIDIVDYKLKNIDDDKYIEQLNGYKEYIKSISNKKINMYLYSIIDEKIKVL